MKITDTTLRLFLKAFHKVSAISICILIAFSFSSCDDECEPEQYVCSDGKIVTLCANATCNCADGSQASPGACPEDVECTDGIDNDNDGLIDGNDPQCPVNFGLTEGVDPDVVSTGAS